jgi:hypothetical protein
MHNLLQMDQLLQQHEKGTHTAKMANIPSAVKGQGIQGQIFLRYGIKCLSQKSNMSCR